MKQDIQVHCLPTQKASKNSIIQFASGNGYYIASKKDALIVNNKHFGKSTGIPHHLYGTIDEKPKEGDWMIYNTINAGEQLQKCDILALKELDGTERKVVATDDKDLKIETSIGNQGTTMFNPLPQISPEFQAAWVKAQQEGKPIVDAQMETEDYLTEELALKGSFTNWRPKLNDKGYVTILPVTKKQSNWINVETKLPKERIGWSHSVDVNILYEDNVVSTGSYRYLNIKEWGDYLYPKRDKKIIAWQPLPEPTILPVKEKMYSYEQLVDAILNNTSMTLAEAKAYVDKNL